MTGNLTHITTPTGLTDPAVLPFNPGKFVWDERQGVSVTNLPSFPNPHTVVGIGQTMYSGLYTGTVDSHLVYAPGRYFDVVNATITFSQPVISLQFESGDYTASFHMLNPWDAVFCLNGLEDVDGGVTDLITFGGSLVISGNQLTINQVECHTLYNETLALRIITAVPSPGVGTVVLLGAALTLHRRRRV